MIYKIVYKSSVVRDLKKIDKTEAGRILDEIEKELGQSPDSHPVLKGTFAGLRRFRVGDYRVVYAIMDEEVVVLRLDMKMIRTVETQSARRDAEKDFNLGGKISSLKGG